MAVDPFDFSTGPCTLQDNGVASYNGCVFSPLFASTLNGTAVKDEARRTVKYMEYTLEFDGYVTSQTIDPIGPPPGIMGLGIAPTMASVATALTAQGGALTYTGRGFDFVLNAAGARVEGLNRDVVWGPVPELLEFQPLGGGMSAKVKWRVTFRVVVAPGSAKPSQRLLQFNCETSLSYGEDYFSSISIRGTMEIPLTRFTQGDRKVTRTVDDVRTQLDKRIFAGVDESVIKVVKRDYTISRDKRTMEFDVVLEEKPYMDLPFHCTLAKGSYSVRPAKAGMGLCLWLCTLRGTYTVRADETRRRAWWAFLALLRLRMASSASDGDLPVLKNQKNESNIPPTIGFGALGLAVAATNAVTDLASGEPKKNSSEMEGKRTFLIDFSIDEGIYQDSKTVTFSATWKLQCLFQNILLASKIWRKLPESSVGGQLAGNIWSVQMRNVSGANSWLPNTLDPQLDVIVDFGS